jgi:hypothetical protein
MNFQKTFKLIVVGIIITSCQKDPLPEIIKHEKVSGYIQKGPFINGTDITIFELDQNLIPTGKNFTSQVTDNNGNFDIRNIELASPFVELKATGFYFNEVANENSSAQITLFALSDLSGNSNVNVNIFSNLERNRALHLISQGKTFKEAKQQAQSEILTLFEAGIDMTNNSELLDINKTGEGNAALLAASVIIQGYLAVGEFSELLANISTDIASDGKLDNAALGSILMNNARLIKPARIKENLQVKYQSMGVPANIPNFEVYIDRFIQNSDFIFTAYFAYPETGKFGTNLLFPEKTSYANGDYSMKSVIPKGANLRVKIQGNNWMFPGNQENTGWSVGDWNMEEGSRTFTSTRTGDLDFRMMLNTFNEPTPIYIKIFVYENDDQEPTWEKTIILE